MKPINDCRSSLEQQIKANDAAKFSWNIYGQLSRYACEEEFLTEVMNMCREKIDTSEYLPRQFIYLTHEPRQILVYFGCDSNFRCKLTFTFTFTSVEHLRQIP